MAAGLLDVSGDAGGNIAWLGASTMNFISLKIAFVVITLIALALKEPTMCYGYLQSEPRRVNEFLDRSDHSYFLAFTENGQAASADLPNNLPGSKSGCIIHATAGTVVRTERTGLQLLCGCMTVESTSKPIRIFCDLSDCFLCAHSSAVIERINEQETISVVSGTSLVQASEKCAHTQMPLTSQKRVPTQMPLALNYGLSNVNLVSELQIHAGQTLSICRTEDGISAKRGQLLRGAITCSKKHVPRPALVIASPGTSFSASEKTLAITKGSMIADLPKGTSLMSQAGPLHFLSRGLVAVRLASNLLCIENCSVPEVCTMSIRGTRIELLAGREILIRHGVPSLAMVPHDGVARRNFTARFDGGIGALICDFELTSLLRSDPSFRAAVKAPATPAESRIAETLIKNAAILALALSGRGEYGVQTASPRIYRLGAMRDSLADSQRVRIQ